MNDLEITLQCAKALGLTIYSTYVFDDPPNSPFPNARCVWVREYHDPFDPLHDDAQAMALMKKLSLNIGCPFDKDASPGWEVWPDRETDTEPLIAAMNPDLNRAVVECVAKMQKAKHE